jgi:pimeloyl-ACP methyl ester carboxylesterase
MYQYCLPMVALMSCATRVGMRNHAGSEWVLFEHSSHMAHVEERELYLATVQAFIEGVEARAH